MLLANLFFFLLAAILPFGTRLLLRLGNLHGAHIEPGTLSLYVTQILVFFVVALVIFHGRKNLRPAVSSPVLLAAAAFVVTAFLSTLTADNPHDVLLHCSWLLPGLGVILAALLTKIRPSVIAWGLVIGGVAQAWFALFQILMQKVLSSSLLGIAEQLPATVGVAVVESTDRFLRAYGTFSHPNILGLYLVIALLSAITLATRKPSFFSGLALSTIPLLSVGLLLSFSRSAIVAFSVAVIFLLIIIFRKNSTTKLSTLDFRLLPFFLVAFTFIILAIPLRHQLFSRVQLHNSLEAQSINQRTQSLQDGFALFQRHPLFGVGLGRMPYATAREIDPGRKSGWDYQNAHAVPVMALAETGILGFLAWLALIVYVLRAFWLKIGFFAIPAKAGTHKNNVDEATLGLAAAFLACLIASLFDHFLWSLWPGVFLFWLLIASAEVIDNPQ